MSTKSISRVDPDEVLRLTQDLIGMESHCDTSTREGPIGEFLSKWFNKRGIDTELQPVASKRANLIARLPVTTGETLMLCGHLDTVPAGNMESAFNPRIDGDKLWGRGASDMKGAVAAMACTLVAVSRADTKLAGNLLFAGTVGEETGAIGVKKLVDGGVTADYAIVGEPTSLRIGIAHKGVCFVRISISGQGAHGSTPEQGVNAVSYAARITNAIEEELRHNLASRKHRLLGSPTVNVGKIRGGSQPNIVAESCQIDIDRRTIPSEDNPLEEIRSLVDRICSPVDGLSHKVEEMEQTSVVPHTPLSTDLNCSLAKVSKQCCKQFGLDSDPIGVTFWTDGGHLAEAGIETVIIGPGNIALAHGPRESVHIPELEKSANLYTQIAYSLLNAQ